MATLLALALLTLPGLAFALPFYGLPASLVALKLGVPRGAALWTRRGEPAVSMAVLGAAALWLLPLLSFVGLFYALLGEEASNAIGTTSWLFIPLCGPVDMTTPAVVAFTVYAAGAAASAVVRKPWPWLLGGLAANIAYDLTMHLHAIEVIC